MNTPPSAPVIITEDAIARRARQLWDERGRPTGQDVEIWCEAERQLRTETAAVVHPSPVAVESSIAAAKSGPRPRKRRLAADDINADEVEERLEDFGDPGRRSPTSANLP